MERRPTLREVYGLVTGGLAGGRRATERCGFARALVKTVKARTTGYSIGRLHVHDML